MGPAHVHGNGDAVALEASAGLALGCTYSSSDEYEAEVIRSRRAAGAYGISYQREYVMLVLAIVTGGLLYFVH